MATKREIATLAEDEFEDIIDVKPIDETKLQEDIDAEEARITSEFDADNKDVKWLIKVYRVLEKEGRMNWLFNCLPSELPIIDKLRDNYGSGLYRARVYRNGKLYRALDYAIEAPKFPEPPKQDTNKDIAAIINAMMQAQERQFNKLQEILLSRASAPAPTFDPVQMLASMTQIMLQMRQLVEPKNDNSQIEMLLKGIEIAKDVVGGNNETSFLDLARDLIKSPLLAKAVEATAHPPIPPSVPSHVQAVPKPSVNPVSTNSVNPATPKESKESVMIKYYVGMLIDRAQRGSDPALYADFILDNVPEEIIRQYLARENLIEEIQKIDPRAAQHKEWLIALRDYLIEGLTDEEPIDNNSGDMSSFSSGKS